MRRTCRMIEFKLCLACGIYSARPSGEKAHSSTLFILQVHVFWGGNSGLVPIFIKDDKKYVVPV